MHSYTYPIFIFNVDISFLVNKELHHIFMTSCSCNVQGSFLVKRKKDKNKSNAIVFSSVLKAGNLSVSHSKNWVTSGQIWEQGINSEV